MDEKGSLGLETSGPGWFFFISATNLLCDPKEVTSLSCLLDKRIDKSLISDM